MFAYGKLLMRLRDERTTLLNEMIQGIQVIKFFAWEDSFVERINGVREREMTLLKYVTFPRQWAEKGKNLNGFAVL